MSNDMTLAAMDERDSDMLMMIMARLVEVQGAESAELKFGPPDGMQVTRRVTGPEWAAMQPLLVGWLEASSDLIMEMAVCRRCGEEIGELIMRPELGSEAHGIILGKAEAKQAKALRKVVQAKAAERAFAQRLADLDYHVVN